MKYTALILLSAIALAKTEDSGIYPNGCPKDWSVEQLLPHRDCRKFYQCWDGELVEHPCPAHLYFSVETNQCEWSEVIDCTATYNPIKDGETDNTITGAGNSDPSKAPEICAAEGSDSVLIAHEQCNKYYICDHGKPVARRCQVGLFFNPETDRCDWPENFSCGERLIPDGDSEDSNNNDNIGAGNSDPSKAPEICAAEGSDSVLVAHEKCNKYYICDNGKPVPRRCQDGLFFNPNTDRCDWPENVDCGDRLIPGENEDNNDNDDENIGGGNSDPSKAPEICAAEGSDSVLVAHENCNKYYICDNGKPVPRPCQAGLFFNPNTDRCDWLKNVDCGDRIIPGGEDEDNDDNDNGDEDNGDDDSEGDNDDNDNNDDDNIGAGNSDPSEAPEICAAEGSDSVLVAHENCNKYYICAHGVPVPRSCQAGLFFNPNTDRCDWPKNVDCGDRLIPDGEDEDNDDNENGGDENGDDDNEGNDSENDNNDDENIGGGNSDPSEAPEICAAEGSDSVLVAHEKCNKYYICAHGVPVPRPCQAGLFFNPNTDRCDWPKNVDCGDRIIPDGEDEDNDDNGNGGDENGDGDNGGDDNGDDDNGEDDNEGDDTENDNNDDENIGGGNSDPSKAPEICAAEGSDSVLVAHEKCNKYYICAHGVPVPRPCQAGLFFNPNTDRCDWPENVDCGDRLIPDVEDEDNDDNENGGDENGDDDNGDDDNEGNDSENDNNDDENIGGGNSDPSKAPEICAAEGSDSVLVAHEKCNKYYICAHGVPVPRPCQAGLFFNPNTDRCDWPENVDCGDRLIPEVEDEDNDDNENGGDENGDDDNGDDDNEGNDSENDNNDDENIGGGNSDPSKAPEICAAEGSDSVLVAHEKCNKYYICAHGVPVPRPCQAGLFFNPNTDRCDWPENVDCGDRIIPDEEDEDNDNNDNGGDENGDENGDDDNGDDDNEGNDSENDNNDDENIGGGNSDPSKAPEICAAEGSDSVLVAHEKCNKYYICAHGVPVPRPCQAGLFFNPNTDRCDWPENVDCGDRLIPDGEDEDNDDNENGGDENGDDDNGDDDNEGNDSENDNNDDENIGGGNSDPSKAPEICAAEGSDSVLVAHEKCNKYYICAHGVPVPRPCQAGLFFNPNTDRCDWPENVDCGDRIIPDGEDEDNDGNGNGGDENGDDDNNDDENNDNDNEGDDSENDNNDDENIGGGNSDPSKAPEICAAEGSDSVLVAHEKCNKYYICAHGVPVPRPCQAGLFFNPNTDRCDWLENVDCGDRIIPDGEDEDNDNNDNGGDENGDDDNGDGDNEDDDNEGDENEGENDGNDDNDDNIGAGNSDPSEAPEICAAEGSDGVLVANEKCNKYYICAHGVPVPRPCQAGLFFNPNTDRCDWPENVDCGDRLVPDEEDEDNDNNDNGGDENGDDDNGDGNNEDDDNEGDENEGDNENDGNDDNDDNIGAGNSDPSEAPEICAAEGSNGVLVANEKCNKYYICAHGVPVPRPCQAGLFFNPNTDRCDWPENVDCGDRLIPGEEEEDNDDNDNGGNENGDDDNNDNGDEGHDNDNGDDENGGDENGGDDNGGDENEGENENEGNDNNDDNIGAGNSDPSEAPEICAAEGSDGVLVANEKCNKYYICAHGVPVPRLCQAGLFFNPNTDRCDWLENVDCGDRVILDGENGDDDNGDESNGEDDDNYNDEDSNDENDNGGNDNDGSDNGGNDNGGSDNGSSENGGSDNDDNNDNQNVGAGNCDPSKAPEICAAEGSDSVLVAHEKCNKYYICRHGIPVPRRCQVGLFFNPNTDQCDWLNNVDCGDRIILAEENEENDGDDNGGNDSDSDDNSDNDNGSNDNGDDDTGDNSGNDNQNIVDGNRDPSKAPEICAADGSDSVLIAHEKCSKFYLCVNGKPVSFRCPANLVYNPNIEECDWPENVDCSDKVKPDVEDNDNNNSGNVNVGAGNTDPSLAPIICADEKSNGVFVAHEVCSQFYTCSNGKPVTLHCPTNLFFNPSIDQCDWPQLVDCGSRQVPSGFEASLNKHLEARRTLRRML